MIIFLDFSSNQTVMLFIDALSIGILVRHENMIYSLRRAIVVACCFLLLVGFLREEAAAPHQVHSCSSDPDIYLLNNINRMHAMNSSSLMALSSQGPVRCRLFGWRLHHFLHLYA
ncbi:hypothetical protein NC653_014404 [Populus alba x Populus x berolinensis]|uniref:Uncharacterized protein n=1 Tax=Populus alba x Populus x berolinensis TaxID=444605 RepID=A0AAD6W3T8_9ROSI|nr:hypothetical protein NC653_014404 [Populus alba x Populus x berolinensis]